MSWSGHAGGSDAAAQALAARARGGDQAALEQLAVASHDGGWAPDHRGAAIDAWNSLGIGAPLAAQKNPHGFLGDFGKTLGGVLKVAAPIAGALIPGVGMLGAGLIGAGGSALGGALHGDKFDLGKTLLAGGGSALGNKALGNGLGGGSSNMGFGSSLPGQPGGIPGGTTPGSGGTGSSGYDLKTGQPAGGHGLLDRFGDVGSLLQKYGPMALGAAGALSQASEANHANSLRNQGVDMATQDWQQRAPLRQKAVDLAMAPPAPPRDLSSRYADPTDPYRRSA